MRLINIRYWFEVGSLFDNNHEVREIPSIGVNGRKISGKNVSRYSQKLSIGSTGPAWSKRCQLRGLGPRSVACRRLAVGSVKPCSVRCGGDVLINVYNSCCC